MTRTLIRITLATASLIVAQGLLAVLAPPSALKAPVNLPLAVISTALTTATLFLIVLQARDTGTRLALLLFGVWGGIQANYLVETVVFDIGVPRPDQPWLFAQALAVAAAAALIVTVASGRRGAMATTQAASAMPWLRLVGCGLLYLALYFAAGVVIAFPITEPFYRQFTLPSPAVIFPVQILRGIGFALVVLLIVRRTASDPLAQALTAGLVLSVLGGLAPLLNPNAYLPDLVRLAHLAEIVPSNFVFGALAAHLLQLELTAHASEQSTA